MFSLIITEKYKDFGEKEWYFFTPRDRKYKNGNRPNRRVRDHGGWKATGAEKNVKVDGTVVGHKKTLVYYTKYPPASNADKSSWIMQEYRIVNSTPSNRGRNGMRVRSLFSFSLLLLKPQAFYFFSFLFFPKLT